MSTSTTGWAMARSILGHCHPEVDAAAREGQDVGTVFALGTEREVVVAEMIHDMVPAPSWCASPTPAPRR